MLPIEQKVGQKLMVGFDGLEPPDYLLEWLEKGYVGGIILFSRNIATPKQVAELTQACHDAAPHPILVAIDQEGGTIARLRTGFTESPGAMALGIADSEDMAEQVASVLAKEMHYLGINWVLAPVADLTQNVSNRSVGTRSLGRNKERVSKLVAAQIRGFQQEHVAACVKHFPSLGNTSIDTHEELPKLNTDIHYIRQNDLVPFCAAIEAGVATVIVSHVRFTELDNQYPATLSPIIINQLLRQEIGFTGVISTDCMEMKAITNHYGAGESAVLAALAGNDILFFSHTHDYQKEAFEALVEAAQSGRYSEIDLNQSVNRIRELQQHYGITEKTNADRIRHPDYLQIMEKAARSGIVILKQDPNIFPLKQNNHASIGIIEFASNRDADALKHGEFTEFSKALNEHTVEYTIISLNARSNIASLLEDARNLADTSEILIVVTRNAHLEPEQLEITHELISISEGGTILLCLCNPYDADMLPEAGTILCTFSDSAPSLSAAIDAVWGEFVPKATVPIGMLDLYP